MDAIIKDLSINEANLSLCGASYYLCAVVHSNWLKSLLKDKKIDENHKEILAPKLQTGENVSAPWKKIFIQFIEKRKGKVLPLARSKLSSNHAESILSFTQILQYVSQTNHRNIWKEAYKKYSIPGDVRHAKETSSVNLVEHDHLICEIILRMYGCEIIKLVNDMSNHIGDFPEMSNRNTIKMYQSNHNLVSVVCALESERYFYIIHETFYHHNLLDALMFSPSLLDSNQSRGLFLTFQLVQLFKSMYDRNLYVGNIRLEDIYLNENLWLQVIPTIANSIIAVNPSLIVEHGKTLPYFHQMSTVSKSIKFSSKDSSSSREKMVCLEKVCNLWIRGMISNLDYLIHLNNLAGRNLGDPRVHPVVPWVTDFTSRCGKNWRDLTKSKYRLTKGDRQLDLTYDVMVKEGASHNHPQQVPHHVSDVLSDITYYVYMARRTPKNVLCLNVRNNWVPAEYPVSIQRMQEWTPDECIPEFYTDPSVFKSIHEDLHDLEIPTWATCIEDFIYKHREALESNYVSENLHHWIDLTFGYKLSGTSSIKAKNVCLSLVDGHERLQRGGAVQLLHSPHPVRKSRPVPAWAAPSPPRIYRTKDSKKNQKSNESSEDVSDDDDTSLPKHISRLTAQGDTRSKSKNSRNKRAGKKHLEEGDLEISGGDKLFQNNKYLKAQKSEWGKEVIYLPKEYNAVGALTAVENYHLFRIKTFYNHNELIEDECSVDLKSPRVSPSKSEVTNDSISSGYRADINSDENSFTNQMFVKSYERILKTKLSSSSDASPREWKDRSFNSRMVTDWMHYKEAVLKNKKRDMHVLGCLIVEIFLHQQLRALRSKMNVSFEQRLACCRLVFQYNCNIFPKFASSAVKLLLDMESSCVTLKGLPMPTSSQLLQPLLYNHLIPFPKYFPILYSMITALREFSIALDELEILYSFDCDGHQCSKYEHIERTKFRMSQKIAEGKVYSFYRYFEMFNDRITYNRIEFFDLFIPYFVDLLDNNDTAILAAWYLFDPVSQILGPDETSKKLLTLILRLYDDDNSTDRSDIYCKSPEVESPTAANCSVYINRKSIKLYHHIFLLQLNVRFGLKCFLENFTQRLVEAVGGYKDMNVNDFSVHSHSNDVSRRSQSTLKKLRCCDESLKVAMSCAADILSPDTSCGSENIITPNVELNLEHHKSKQTDTSVESELFHFENDPPRNDCLSSCTELSCPAEESLQSFSSAEMLTRRINLSTNFEKPLDPTEVNDSMSSQLKNVNLQEASSDRSESDNDESKSPTIPTSTGKTTFRSYIETEADSKTYDCDRRSFSNTTDKLYSDRSMGTQSSISTALECKISEVASESLIWLSHRLGPVLTCIYLTRNLLKMLTLCYIGPENLVPIRMRCSMGMESLSVAESQIVGDLNAAKVIECLTTIAALYGEQLILLQYLPHMGKLIASCRRRLSAPLEGGLIACLQLLRYLIPCMSDVKLMEQLQDILLKNILHPTVRLLSSTRSTFPSGSVARSALAKKFVDAMYVIALRIGPEMTRRHLCVPALQRFFLAFDKASGKAENWIKSDPDSSQSHPTKPNDSVSLESGDETNSAYLEICRDGSTAEWRVVDGNVVGKVHGDSSCSPPPTTDQNEPEISALQELQEVFHLKLAHRSYTPFSKFVGEEAMERSLKNPNTLKTLCQEYHDKNSPNCNPQQIDRLSPTLRESPSDYSLSRRSLERLGETVRIGMDVHLGKSRGIQCQRVVPQEVDDGSGSNSFGSNAPLIGNRIDVPSFDDHKFEHGHALDIVSCKMETGDKASRHLKGDWLLYWEHEIGRPDKDNRFNLKQIKLQTFCSHTHSVKSIVVLDNENSFMTSSKDKTVKLWSLRNSGDGSSTSTCQWTYTAHKKGILSLSFVDSLRLAVSTDSIVHIWDPYIESVVSQLDNPKNAAISIVEALPAPSTSVVAATTDNTLKIIDTRTCSFVQDLKVAGVGGSLASASGSIRSVCCSPSGRWLGVAMGGGSLCVLDTRTGAQMATWRAHDTEPLKVCAANDNTLVSSGLDFIVAAWRPQDGRLQAHLKATSEPVHCLATYYQELITGTTNNRIGVHTAVDQDASFSSTKLRSEVFKGSLTSLAVLPMNRLLLLGGDSGHISLIC